MSKSKGEVEYLYTKSNYSSQRQCKLLIQDTDKLYFDALRKRTNPKID